jgi:DNA-binding NarL/FixJ family response regulator
MSATGNRDRIRVVVVQDDSCRPNAVREALDGEPGIQVIHVLSLTRRGRDRGAVGEAGDGAGDGGGDSTHHDGVDPPPVLSVREREVLALVDQAMSNRQIAGHLSITEGTVKRHLCNIFAKLGAVSRIDAVNKARSTGLIGNERRSSS